MLIKNKKDILEAIFSLPPTDRIEIIETVMDDFGNPETKELEKIWADEADKRIDAFLKNEVSTIPAEDVFNSLINPFS